MLLLLLLLLIIIIIIIIIIINRISKGENNFMDISCDNLMKSHTRRLWHG